MSELPSFNQFTTLAKQAIQRSHEMAIERNQTHVTAFHLLIALINQEESIVPALLEKLDIDINHMFDWTVEFIDNEVYTHGGQQEAMSLYLTPDLAQIIELSVGEAKKMKDDFVSVEHLFLAIYECQNPAKEVLIKYHVHKEKILAVIHEMREFMKQESVRTSPSVKFLAKFTRNLTEMARVDKLDPVIGPRMRTAQGVALIAALQDYAAAHSWSGLQLTLAPAIYNLRSQDLLPFSLFVRDFQLKHRWNCYAIRIEPDGAERYAKLFRDRQASFTRAARRRGVSVLEGGSELLPDFVPLFHDTYQRHGASPTHTIEEIADLLARFPGRISLVIAKNGEIPVAGLLVMRINTRVAYSFYICNATAHADEHANLVAFAALLDTLGNQGFEWLDTGPGAWDGNFNSGVVYFKEGLGATGHCRDCWYWPVPPYNPAS